MTQLVEPTLTVHDVFQQNVTFSASSAVTALLRSEAEENYTKAIERLAALGLPAAGDWDDLAVALENLGRATEAVKVIRATTPAADEDGSD
jgi:hypothetical protein